MANKALCIGINNYPGTENDLAGCINDANDWRDCLEQRGFVVTQLLDAQATKSAMRRQMEKLVKEAHDGDVIVVTYSGHGSWIPDENGDEPDGRDEVLCPHDLKQNGPITDDDLYQIFAPLETGVHTLFVSDSCHSGSVLKATVPRTTETSKQRVRFMSPEDFLPPAQLMRARTVEAASRRRDRAPRRSKALLFAAAEDREYSYDTEFNGRPNGAFTRFAIDALKTLSNTASYAEWHQRVRQYLPDARWPQSPVLFGSTTQKSWRVFNSRREVVRFTSTTLEDRLNSAQPGEQLDFSDVDRSDFFAAMEGLSQRKRQLSLVRGDETDWGAHIHSHVDWWDPFHISGLATIEIDHEAMLAFDQAITLPHLLAVGVPAPAAAIVAGVVWMLRDLDRGNGINMYVQLPSLVHWWFPR